MADRKYFNDPLNEKSLSRVQIPRSQWSPKVEEYIDKAIELSELQAEILRADYINNKPWVDRLNRQLAQAGQFRYGVEIVMKTIARLLYSENEIHRIKSQPWYKNPLERIFLLDSYPDEIQKDARKEHVCGPDCPHTDLLLREEKQVTRVAQGA